MFAIFRTLALSAGLVMAAVSAQATVWHYDLFDHPDGALGQHEYGLRVDTYGKVFSFENGAQAYLSYDDSAGTVTLFGTMRESLGNGSFGAGLWNLMYTMTGVSDVLAGKTVAGDGYFVDLSGSGSGSISQGGTTHVLGAKANGAGEYFLLLDDGHRFGNHQGLQGRSAGRGWVNPPNIGGTNDFLFTAESRNGPPPGPNPVPLPAAGWMLLAGLGGLRLMKSRRRPG